MRLLEIGVIVVAQVPENPAEPDISADELEPRAAETTEPTVTYHAVMFHTGTRFEQHERSRHWMSERNTRYVLAAILFFAGIDLLFR
jgi:hypothetical protein